MCVRMVIVYNMLLDHFVRLRQASAKRTAQYCTAIDGSCAACAAKARLRSGQNPPIASSLLYVAFRYQYPIVEVERRVCLPQFILGLLSTSVYTMLLITG